MSPRHEVCNHGYSLLAPQAVSQSQVQGKADFPKTMLEESGFGNTGLGQVSNAGWEGQWHGAFRSFTGAELFQESGLRMVRMQKW